MQTLRLTPNTAEPNVPSEGIVCHDVRNPAQRSEVLARKGTTIGADDIRALLKRGVLGLHLALPEVGDVDEDERPRAWRRRLPGQASLPSRRI